MTIKKNTVVSVNYHLSAHVENEAPELIEQTSKENPFVFLFGAGQLIPDFEKNLLNKKAGDAFDFVVAPDQSSSMYAKLGTLGVDKKIITYPFVFHDWWTDAVKVTNTLDELKTWFTNHP